MDLFSFLNLCFFSLGEGLGFISSFQFYKVGKEWIFSKIFQYSKSLRTFFMALRIFFFPVRGNFIIYERHTRIVEFEEYINDGEESRMVNRKIILPPSLNTYHWNKVIATIETENDQDEFSSTEESGDENEDSMKTMKEIKVKDNFYQEDVTENVLAYAGSYKDFYGVQITPRMIDEKYHKLTFQDKDRRTGLVKTNKIFNADQIINLEDFL